MNIKITCQFLLRTVGHDQAKCLAPALLLAVLILCPALAQADTRSAEFERGRTAANSGDFKQALKIWTALAESGDAWAEYSIGRLHANGDGVPRDYATARTWFKRAADHGLPAAQNALAKTYYYGDGGPREKDKAIEWFRRAAENGDRDAMRRLSSLGVKLEPGNAKATQSKVEDPKTDKTEPALPPPEDTSAPVVQEDKSDTFNFGSQPTENESPAHRSPENKIPESDSIAKDEPAPTELGAVSGNVAVAGNEDQVKADPLPKFEPNEPTDNYGQPEQKSTASKLSDFLSGSAKYGAYPSDSASGASARPAAEAPR